MNVTSIKLFTHKPINKVNVKIKEYIFSYGAKIPDIKKLVHRSQNNS